ncbi:MAG: MBL fold metallo-hydrolase [Planctomycetes bacterium]|nr:MBL fold metallo-hydrolase [Planctomycetota bacterium]
MSGLPVHGDVYVVGRNDWGGLPALSRGCSCNVFLLDGGDELALIDVGVPDGVDEVLRNVRGLGFDPGRIRTVLLTHSHWDHAAALAPMLRATGANAYGHALAKETMSGGPGIYVPEYQAMPHTPAHVVAIADGDGLDVGRHRLTTIGVPGHTPDSLAFAFATAHGPGCFTGDTAIGDQPTGDGVIGWISCNWRTDLDRFAASLEHLRALKIAAMFPGHGNSHLTRAACDHSLANCQHRLAQLMAIPDLGTMIPLDPVPRADR